MTTSTRAPERSPLVTLLWIMLFDHTSLNIIFPVLTLLFFDSQSRLFSATTSEAVRSYWYGVCIAIPHAVNFFCAPLLGMLSDCFGRRAILLVAAAGALLFALTAAAGVLYGSLALFIMACFVRGVFSRTNPVAQAVVGDLEASASAGTEPNRKMRNMGYLQTAISLGAFMGPILGGQLANFWAFDSLNFSLPFFVAAGFAALAFFLTFGCFSETLPLSQPLSFRRMAQWTSIRLFFANKRIVSISLILLFSQISWSLYYQFIPPALKLLLKAEADQIGYFVGLIALWLAMATLFGIRLMDQFLSATGILMASLGLVLAGTLLTVLFLILPIGEQAHWLLWVAALPVAAGDVVAFSCLCTFYSDAVGKSEQGRIMGVCFIVIAAVWTVTGFVGGLLFAIQPLLPLALAPTGALVAMYCARRMPT